MAVSDVSEQGSSSSEEASRSFEQIYKRAWKAMRDYALLEDNDRILVGISGGKDSLVLAEVLARKMKAAKPSIQVQGLHVAMEGDPYRMDRNQVEALMHSWDIPLHILTIPCPWAQPRGKKPPCFLCSWERRKALFAFARETGCNKIALGHHLDDVLQTFLMNQVFQGSLSTIPPLLRMNSFDMTLIRPLFLIEESDMEHYASLRGYQAVTHACPHEESSHRSGMKEILNQFREMNPRATRSMLQAMHNVMPDYLPDKRSRSL
jgi:tRNA(Ile)-lysidine synthase TilS/MesJ